MNKKKQAKKILMAELKKENGRFVTQRMIDRLRLFHTPLSEGSFLSDAVEEVNRELAVKPGKTPPFEPGSDGQEPEEETIESTTSASSPGQGR
jgi:hypothetical protein